MENRIGLRAFCSRRPTSSLLWLLGSTLLLLLSSVDVPGAAFPYRSQQSSSLLPRCGVGILCYRGFARARAQYVGYSGFLIGVIPIASGLKTLYLTCWAGFFRFGCSKLERFHLTNFISRGPRTTLGVGEKEMYYFGINPAAFEHFFYVFRCIL